MSGAPLLTSDGRAALAQAMSEPDPTSLGAATRLRAKFSPELAAAAASQAQLRAKAVAKFGAAASEMFFTSTALEQATRPAVAAWRAKRLVERGVSAVLDAGCAIGADSLAFADAGLKVVGIEIDPLTAEYARANLGEKAEIITGDVTQLAAATLTSLGDGAALYLDPARRTAAGRTWRVTDFSPAWEFVLSMLDSKRHTCIKLGPGLDKDLIPAEVEACWVADHQDTVETSLWHGPGVEAGSCAVILPSGRELRRPRVLRELDVRAPGRYLIEPNGAVIRAGVLSEIAPECEMWLLDSQIAYLSSDERPETPFGAVFEIAEIIDYSEKAMRAWIRAHEIGVLEIKTRGIDLDPAQLRRRLKPAGKNSATMIVARTLRGAAVLVGSRVVG